MLYPYGPYGLLVMIIVGLIAGWLAGQVMRGGGFGLVGNLVVGILGAIVGNYLFWFLGLGVIGGSFIGPIIVSSIGAVVLLYVIGLVQK